MMFHYMSGITGISVKLIIFYSKLVKSVCCDALFYLTTDEWKWLSMSLIDAKCNQENPFRRIIRPCGLLLLAINIYITTKNVIWQVRRSIYHNLLCWVNNINNSISYVRFLHAVFFYLFLYLWIFEEKSN